MSSSPLLRAVASLLAGAALDACPLSAPTLDLYALAGDGNPCVTVEDCCVVVDPCGKEAFIVTSDEIDRARELVDARSDEACYDCESPPTAVDCVNGACLGKAFDPNFVSYAEGQAPSSCGPRELRTDQTDPEGTTFVPADDGVVQCREVP